MRTILVVEDESAIRTALRTLLTGEGYGVTTARNGEEALVKFSESRPDLVLMDVMMPRTNGFCACEKMRKIDRDVPIIFLTALTSDADEVRGIGLGADDYISKTADNSVLIARIRRALARASSIPPRISSSSRIVLGAVTIDLDSRMVVEGSRKEQLTAHETCLIRSLNAKRGEIVPLETLFAALHGKNYIGDINTLRPHIKNLRRKLGKAGEMIVNVSGVGYYLVK